MKLSAAFAALLPAIVSAVDIPVAVGQGGLTFEPSSVQAAAGDVVVFTFYGGNHTATESTFERPCTTRTEDDADETVGDSGFIPVSSPAEARTWNYTVTDDDSVWFYCAQTAPVDHCAAGMVFAINPDDATDDDGETFEAFQERARTGGGGSPTDTPSPSDTTSGASPTNTQPGNNDNNGGSGNQGGNNGATSLVVSTGAAALVFAGALMGAAI